MATRFYLQSTGSPSISPAVHSSWDAANGLVRRPMGTAKANSAMATESRDPGSTSESDYGEVALQFICPTPLAAQTINGTIKGRMRVASDNVGVSGDFGWDHRARATLRVLSSDGSVVRGVLYAGVPETYGSFNHPPAFIAANADADMRNISFPNIVFTSDALTEVVSEDGDLLVLEIGITVAAGVDVLAKFRIGDPTGSTDLAEDETTTTDNAPWIEISHTITFSGGGGGGTAALLMKKKKA